MVWSKHIKLFRLHFDDPTKSFSCQVSFKAVYNYQDESYFFTRIQVRKYKVRYFLDLKLLQMFRITVMFNNSSTIIIIFEL